MTEHAVEKGVSGQLVRWSRRVAVIAVYLVLFVLLVGLLPVALPAAAVVDLVRRSRFVLLRVLVFFVLYLGCELVGVLVATALWVGYKLPLAIDRQRYLRWNFALQCAWARALGLGAFRIFGITLKAGEPQSPNERPILLLLRHASVADTILAAVLVASRYGVLLRYVLKRELLWDPCLDLVGHRLPNCFVDRGSHDSVREVARVGALARGLVPGEGVLIYPEGTRASPRKRARIIDSAMAREDSASATYAGQLLHVLPPRLGGVMALLAEAPAADVVFCVHTGLEGSGSFWDLWNGGLVGSTVRVTFRTVRHEDIPSDNSARRAWLLDQWRRVDAEVGRLKALSRPE